MKAFKIFVLWLLLSVIPLQGIAVNVLLTCKAAHPQLATTPDARTHMDHDTIHDTMHDAAHAPADQSGHSKHVQSSDGSCAAGCGGALWMHADRLTPPVLQSPFNHVSYLSFHLPFVVPDVPEHPPRSLSA